MSLHYIIDGYNVVKQVPLWADKRLEEARDFFVNFIRINQLAGSLRNKVTVVFDAKGSSAFYAGDRLEVGSTRYPGIRVFFSKAATADEAIIGILKETHNPKNVVVVSDDRQLRFVSRSLGGQLMSVRDFLSRGDKSKNNTGEGVERPLSLRQERQINEYLRKIWL